MGSGLGMRKWERTRTGARLVQEPGSLRPSGPRVEAWAHPSLPEGLLPLRRAFPLWASGSSLRGFVIESRGKWGKTDVWMGDNEFDFIYIPFECQWGHPSVDSKK